MIVKIAVGLYKVLPIAELIATCQAGLEAIADSVAIYATPNPPLATVQTAVDALIAANNAAITGGPTQTAVRDAKKAQLVTLMQALSAYVTVTANGDLSELMLSGLPIQQPTRSPIGPLATPQTPVAKKGPVSGTLTAISSPVFGAGIYNWRLALASAPTVYVQTAQTTGARNTFEGLTPGEIYNVQFNAVGAAGASDWSGNASLRVV